jgi:GNAT superfamily N-acetyltransferase
VSRITVTTRNSDPRLMAWDTDFWCQRVGRATKLDGLGEWAVANTVGLVCLLIDADKPAEIQDAEERGFRFMDVRVTLEMATRPRQSWGRLARAEDTSKLQAIAREAFHLTRFYADPTLDDERCDDLYAEWTRSLCAGAASVVLVIEKEETPIGYITVDLDGDQSEIGLVAVASDYRGQHLGTLLVNSAIDWAYSHDAKTMTVVTQGRNIGALRTFEGCGFRVSNTSLWFHKTYREKSK